ncbi:hypothetical protein QVD17_31539 [Tagetes erecta]|uniref:Uncharacterized protein n=1 Tax=Tagetes erecta TaxID=13708 RepID=A0AAD8K4G6_TARER|nr:hypothetical protein QVD17_31539 [Tagetes erecta]
MVDLWGVLQRCCSWNCHHNGCKSQQLAFRLELDACTVSKLHLPNRTQGKHTGLVGLYSICCKKCFLGSSKTSTSSFHNFRRYDRSLFVCNSNNH